MSLLKQDQICRRVRSRLGIRQSEAAVQRSAWVTCEQLEGRVFLSSASIGFNFGADRNAGAYQLQPTDVAGVVPMANWNNEFAAGTEGPPIAPASDSNLVDSTGTALTNVTISWLANGTWDVPTDGNFDQFTGPDHSLMAGYLDNFGGTPVATPASLTSGTLDGNGVLLTGLTGGPFDVYVYSLRSAANYTSNITVTGTNASTKTETANPSTTYVEGTNYLLFPDVSPVNGNLLITPDGTSFRDAFQGIELVPAPTGTPTAPSNLKATLDANGVSADLTWDQNGAANVVKYQVQRGTSATGPFTTIASVNPATTGTTDTYQDTTMHGNQNYWYQVVAFNTLNGGTTSAPSNTAGPVLIPVTSTPGTISVNFGADRVDTTNNNQPFALAPTDTAGVVPVSHWNNASNATGADTVLTDSTGAATTAAVNWQANGTWDAAVSNAAPGVNLDQFPNPSGDYTLMAGYLDNFGGTAPASSAALTSGNLDGNGVLFTGLTPGKVYTVYVYSLQNNDGGTGNITVSGTGSASALETAAASTSYVQGTNYLLYPDVQVTPSGNLLVTPDGVSVRDAIQGIELVPGTAPTSAPAAPTTLAATLDANNNAALTWNENANNAAGYIIQRGTAANGPFTTIATIAPSGGATGTYTDASILPGQQYWYQVIAANTFNGGSQSAPSNVAGPVLIAINTTPQDIGVNFASGANGVAFDLKATDSAGVVPITNWNNEHGATGSTRLLTDVTGANVATKVAWQANTTWDAATQEDKTDMFPTGSGDYTLMAGYLDNFGATPIPPADMPATAGSFTTGKLDGNGVLFTGLTGSAYDVYVYSLPSKLSDGTPPVPRGGSITVTGASATTEGPIVPAVSTSYVQGTNYLLFSGVQVAAGGDLLITPDGTSLRDPIQGVELVPKAVQNVITGTPGNDAITISKDADGTDLDWTLNGGAATKTPLSGSLTINGNGGTDTITLDNSNGDPTPTVLNLNQTGSGAKFILIGLSQPSAGHKLDIENSTVQLNYSGNSILPAVQAAIKSGQITSSAVAANPKLGIADIDSALGGIAGQPANTILLQPALKGDTNLDHKVDFSDLVNLARNYGKTGQDWLHGDFDYNAKVDFSDLVALARNYGQTQAAVTPANANLTAMAIQAGSALVDAQKKKAPAARKH